MERMRGNDGREQTTPTALLVDQCRTPSGVFRSSDIPSRRRDARQSG
jgi:hypothetical protein